MKGEIVSSSVGEFKNREVNVPLGPLRKERW